MTPPVVKDNKEILRQGNCVHGFWACEECCWKNGRAEEIVQQPPRFVKDGKLTEATPTELYDALASPKDGGKCCDKQFVYSGGEGTSHYCCPDHCCQPTPKCERPRCEKCKNCGKNICDFGRHGSCTPLCEDDFIPADKAQAIRNKERHGHAAEGKEGGIV